MGTLCTIAVLAASYFFFVKPALDTTSDAIDSISDPINEAQKQFKEAQAQAQQAQELSQKQAKGKPSGSGAQIDLAKLQACVQRAGQDVSALQRCTARFGP